MEMYKYILQILRTQPIVVFSWGFHNPVALPNDKGLKFQVEGFKYKGTVEVVYIDGKDLFEVVLTDNGEKIEDVYSDCLVSVIDNLVEKTSNYQRSVEDAYGF